MAALANFFLLGLAALPLLGQTLESPNTILVFHSASRSLRPIIGMPGSSYLGAALYKDLDFASVSPDQKAAIVETAGGVSFIHNMESSEEIETAITAIDRILWSKDSTTAILFSSANRQLQWVFHGKARPAIGLPENVRLLAAQPDGQQAIVAADGRVSLITPDAALVQIATLSDPTAATFNDGAIYIADADAHQILKFRDGIQELFLGPTDGIEDPVALLLSADSKSLYVAMKSTRTLSSYDISDKTLTTRLVLDGVPSSFEALSKDTFLLNPSAQAGDPFSVVSTRSGLAASFIPTGAAK